MMAPMSDNEAGRLAAAVEHLTEEVRRIRDWMAARDTETVALCQRVKGTEDGVSTMRKHHDNLMRWVFGAVAGAIVGVVAGLKSFIGSVK